MCFHLHILHLKLFLRGEFLNPVGDVLEGEFWIEGVGPVFILLQEVLQVRSLHTQCKEATVSNM